MDKQTAIQSDKRQTYRQTDKYIDKQTEGKIDRWGSQIDRQIDSQIKRQTEGKIDKFKDRQTYSQTDRQTEGQLD